MSAIQACIFGPNIYKKRKGTAQKPVPVNFIIYTLILKQKSKVHQSLIQH